MTPFSSWLLALFMLSGCSQPFLTVHTDYLSHENLASYHVRTPDPLLNHPPIGQRLIVTWSIPKNYLAFDDLHLEISIRFRNREQLVENLSLLKRSGTYVYALLNEDYTAKRGILTYKVNLIGNGQPLEEWRHQIWAELIVMDQSCAAPPEERGSRDSILENVDEFE